MPAKKYDHVDEWLDDEKAPASEYPARYWLEKFRAPALKKDEKWIKAHRLTCLFQGKRYRVVGCSRMGDIWLSPKIEKPQGYELRVDLNDCSDFQMAMDADPYLPDFDSPWRLLNDFQVTGYHMPVIVDVCNHVLWAAHTRKGVYEHIVEIHNAQLKPFVSEWDALDDDEKVDIPSDAHLHDDPVVDHRICNAEGWGLFNIDSTGIMEIQRDDEANAFSSDAEALVFVRGRANKGSPYHQKALQIHNRHAEQASYYRDGHTIEKSKLERLEQVAVDVKKSFAYVRSGDEWTWAWFDRGEEDNRDAWHGGFATRHLALMDAVGPYLIDGDG